MGVLALRGGREYDESTMPLIDQERIALLCKMKNAQDFYDVCFASAEHDGFVRGLFMSMQISAPLLVVFQCEARRVFDAAHKRLLVDVSPAHYLDGFDEKHV